MPASPASPAVENFRVAAQLTKRGTLADAMLAVVTGSNKNHMAGMNIGDLTNEFAQQHPDVACRPSTRARITTSDNVLFAAAALEITVAKTLSEELSDLSWAALLPVKDFQETLIARTTPPALLPLGEGGEIQNAGPVVNKETVTIDTFAVRFSVSEWVICNDYGGIFQELARQAAASARAHLAGLLFGKLTSNPVLDDGTALFATERGTLGSAAALSLESLGAAVAAMRRQTVNGLKLNPAPAFLLVAPEQEMTARTLIAGLTPPGAQPPVKIIADPNIESGFYLLADPVYYPVIARVTLARSQGFAVDVQPKSLAAALQFRVLADHGAAAVGWLGAHFTPAQ